ncbi:MAG: hypothetical protein DYG89_31150 [Caldilinea sp. CFX5]|nr:hypothetical protein [Caldilinea sp. CFX5]
MMRDSFDVLTAEEFAHLMNEFIDHEDPDAISLTALDEAAHEQLAQVEKVRIVLTGCIQDGQIVFDPTANAPITTNGNEVIIGGLHLVVDLREEVLVN